jgi:hypothetical protein
MLHGFEDYAEVPPIDERNADADAERSCELLRWALGGVVPNRYCRHARMGPLLDNGGIDLLVATARDLQAGSLGYDLVAYGSVLIALANH